MPGRKRRKTASDERNPNTTHTLRMEFNERFPKGARYKKRIVRKISSYRPFWARERRRIKPEVGGQLGVGRTVSGTARELFNDMGPEARGIGTRTAAKSRNRRRKKRGAK